MNLDCHLSKLPYSKSKPKFLETTFGSKDILPMWVADMDFAIAEPIQKALTDRIVNSAFPYEYKPDSYLAAQRTWYKKHYGLYLTPERTIVVPSVMSSIALIIDNLTDKSDKIIIQPPVYMEFKAVVNLTGRQLIKNPLKLEDDRYVMDFNDLEEKAKLPEAKVMLLCNPHNPVGRVWTPEELKRLVGICRKHGVMIISDEIHKDFSLFGNQFTSILKMGQENIIVATSEGKTFNMCGICDALHIVYDQTLGQKVKRLFSRYKLGATNSLVRVAQETAYQNGDEWLNTVIPVIERNVKTVQEAIKDSPIKLIPMEGTFLAWLDFRDVFQDTKEMFETIVNKTKVGLSAGHWFGREGALFMRMNLATSNDRVKDAINRIVAAVGKKAT